MSASTSILDQAARSNASAQRPTAGDEREGLAGLVERVTFHNPDNGFAVLRLKVRGHRNPVTVGPLGDEE